jgi:hypothetical protein
MANERAEAAEKERDTLRAQLAARGKAPEVTVVPDADRGRDLMLGDHCIACFGRLDGSLATIVADNLRAWFAAHWPAPGGEERPSTVPMYLTCPKCNARHIDDGDFATKVHHTHSCQACGMTWRPAVVPTVGVAFLPGFKNEAGGEERADADAQGAVGDAVPFVRLTEGLSVDLVIGSVLVTLHESVDATILEMLVAEAVEGHVTARTAALVAERDGLRYQLKEWRSGHIGEWKARAEKAEAEVARMRPVVEAAFAWGDYYGSDDERGVGELAETLWEAVRAARAVMTSKGGA